MLSDTSSQNVSLIMAVDLVSPPVHESLDRYRIIDAAAAMLEEVFDKEDDVKPMLNGRLVTSRDAIQAILPAGYYHNVPPIEAPSESRSADFSRLKRNWTSHLDEYPKQDLANIVHLWSSAMGWRDYIPSDQPLKLIDELELCLTEPPLFAHINPWHGDLF